VLDGGESEQLEILFVNLSDEDSLMVRAIGELANWLSSEAETTSDLVQQNDLAGGERARHACRTRGTSVPQVD
jgi:hypothetical protein